FWGRLLRLEPFATFRDRQGQGRQEHKRSRLRRPEVLGVLTGVARIAKESMVGVVIADAPSVLRQIAGWIDDYNEIHSHSAIRLRSPRDFIRAQTQQPSIRRNGALQFRR